MLEKAIKPVFKVKEVSCGESKRRWDMILTLLAKGRVTPLGSSSGGWMCCRQMTSPGNDRSAGLLLVGSHSDSLSEVSGSLHFWD